MVVKRVGGFVLQHCDERGVATLSQGLHSVDDHLRVGRQLLVDRGFGVGHHHITRVSRQHFLIRHVGDAASPRFVLEDTAANGTWLNGVRIGKGQQLPLQHGDMITVLYNDHEVPLLQFRFILLPREGEGDEAAEDPSRDAKRFASGALRQSHSPRSEEFAGERNQSDEDGEKGNGKEESDWIGRHSVTISAGLLLLASAMAANWNLL